MLLAALASSAAAQISTTYFLGANYGTKPRTDPLYVENDFDLYYPLGGCPLGPTCDNTVYPAVVFIHGGAPDLPTLCISSSLMLPVSVLKTSAGYVSVTSHLLASSSIAISPACQATMPVK